MLGVEVGGLVKYLDRVYEVAEIKSDSRGYWVRMSGNPKNGNATPCTGIISESWFNSSSLEIIGQ